MDSFRIATKTDAENIAALVNESYRPEFGIRGWTHESDLVLGARTNPNQIADIISRTDSIVLLGLVRGEIVACVHIEKGGNHLARK